MNTLPKDSELYSSMGWKDVDDDGFAYICATCRDFGELICCELCKEGFHIGCLGLDRAPDEDPWLCNDCKDNKVLCFECKEYGILNEDTLKCSRKSCNKFYHHDCTKNWGKAQLLKSGVVCPHHVCNACGSNRSNGHCKLFRCLDCPVAYHENCCPDGSRLLEDIPGYLLCWKHDDNWKRQLQDAEQVCDPSYVFQRLPLPGQFCDFQIPRSFHEFVKKLKKKPPPFIHIRRNIYLVKRPKRRLEDEYMQCSCIPAGGSQESCGRDCICGMLQYSCSSSCGCGHSCMNLPFQKRHGRKLQLVKTENCGWGLMAAEDIKAGDFLVEYVGEVIDDKTCEERLWGLKERGETNFYMCEISREMVIDATFKGNLSRFINHSCCPNSELQKWQIEEEIRIGVFAITDIRKGEAISYDYQFIQFGTDQPCHCNAPACRGKLGAKPSKQKISAEAALQIVARELMSRPIKKSKLCGGFSVERGYNHIDQFFRQRKTKFHQFTDSGAILPLAKEQKTTTTCVGTRVRVWWPLDQKFYSGKIVEFDEFHKTHKVEYDDGDYETLCMDKETWELEGPMPLRKRRPLEPIMDSFQPLEPIMDSFQPLEPIMGTFHPEKR